MDISDGLVRDGERMAAASGVVLDLDPDVLKKLAAPLEPAAGVLRADPLAWVLGGGEDHGLLAALTLISDAGAHYGLSDVVTGREGGEEPQLLFTAQQLRLSLRQEGMYGKYTLAAEEVDEDFTGHFS